MEAWTTFTVALVLVGAGIVPLADDLAFDDASSDEVTTDATTHHVHIEDFDMDPPSLDIDVGDTVEWHNHDSVSHTATDDGDAWDTGTIASGATASITFDEAAEYTYFCAVHPDQMTGFVLNVLEPNEAPSVAIASPQDGGVLAGEVEIAGTASDPDGSIEEVEVRIDGGEWRTATGTEDWSLTWDSQQVADGEHTIEARSFDGRDHSSIAAIDVTTENPHPDLAVSQLETEAGLTATTVTANVANVGEAEAAATDLEVRYDADNAEGVAGSVAVPSLGIDEAVEIQLEWDTVGKVGEFTITAEVDPAGDVFDFNPANDAQSDTVCVPGAEGATCAVPGTEPPG